MQPIQEAVVYQFEAIRTTLMGIGWSKSVNLADSTFYFPVDTRKEEALKQMAQHTERSGDGQQTRKELGRMRLREDEHEQMCTTGCFEKMLQLAELIEAGRNATIEH